MYRGQTEYHYYMSVHSLTIAICAGMDDDVAMVHPFMCIHVVQNYIVLIVCRPVYYNLKCINGLMFRQQEQCGHATSCIAVHG